MDHRDLYKFQAEARGVRNLQDVIRVSDHNAFIYNRLIAPWLPADKQALIADLACGHGSFLHWLQTKGYARVQGVDASPEQIALATLTGAPVELMDVMTWLERQPAEAWDACFALDFIEHISKDDMMRFLHGTQRALKPGGCLVLRYPNGDSPFVGLGLFNDITHVWTYTTVCLRTLARMHGFSGVEYQDEGMEAMCRNRWLKLPVARLCARLTRLYLRVLTREDNLSPYWNSIIWACLRK